MEGIKYNIFIPKIRQKFILNALKENKRIDNRAFNEYRAIKIKYGHLPNADGSAEVSLGNTIVLAGVKIDVSNPFPSEPDKGILIVNAEFPPVASPDFEPGPPDENAIELARIVDRGLRKPEVVDFSSLCIIPGQKVYRIWLDIYALNHDGNLVDAAGIAAVVALMNTKYRKFTYVQDKGLVDTGEKVQLSIKNFPVFVTHAKIGDQIILDPNLEEEMLADCKITTIVSEGGLITGMQKSGIGSLTLEDIDKILIDSINLYQKVKENILKEVNRNA
ncbi:MAG: exosome complex protein Rrp42 [Thermoproteota archaeon]|jgi:exosome complex component RRP42|nr:exosome complex protein Rrp42 [Thermoproteota archaeon]